MNKLDWKSFQTPPKETFPMVRWWWTGLDVNKEELCRELDDMAEMGFAGGEIQAFTRNDMLFNPDDQQVANRVHGYGTRRYFELVRDLMAEAKKRGLLLDITAGSGWPMGDTNITPETGMQTFIVGSTVVEGGGYQEVSLPDPAKAVDDLLGVDRTSFHNINGVIIQVMDYPRMKRNMKLMRVTIAKPIGEPGHFARRNITTTLLDPDTAQDVTGYVADGKLCYTFPEGTWQVFAAYTAPSYQHVKSDSKQFQGRESYVVNHFADALVEQYLDRHIGQGLQQGWDAFIGEGNPMRAFFADSFELVGPYFWTDNFLAEFRHRRGYDLSPYLPLLMTCESDGHGENGSAMARMDGASLVCFDFGDGVGERIRYDYEKTLAEIFIEYFIEEMEQWGHKHGVKSRVQCYGHVMDNMRAFGRSDIPETEQLASNGLIDFMKMASSSAILYEKPLVTCESLVWPQRDYMETPLKMKTASDRLTISGVGQMIYHGMPYLNERYPWPGFFPWHNAHGTFVSRNNTIWPWMKQINTAIARNQLMVQQGTPVMDVAIYFQNFNYDFGHHDDFMEELSAGVLEGIDRPDELPPRPPRRAATKWMAVGAKMLQVANTLMEQGYDYCHINEECLEKAVLENGVLHLGGGYFRALVVPACNWMELGAAQKIAQLQKAGFPVIFVEQVPQTVPGFLHYQQLTQQLQTLLGENTPITLEQLAQTLENKGIARGITFTASDSTAAAGMQQVHRAFSNAEVYFVRSRLPEKRMVTLTFPFENPNIRILNAWDGTVTTTPVQVENGKTSVTLPFVSYGSQLIVFGDPSALPKADDGEWLRTMERSICGKAVLDLSRDWQLSAVSAIEQENGRTITKAIDAGDWADDPQLMHFSGTGTYAKTFHLDTAPDPETILDLGLVGDIAAVTVNGVKLPDLLTLPYAAKVGSLLHAGENTVTVTVTTTLRNGMIGADRFGGKQRQKSMAGMVGPVVLKV